MSSIGPVAVDLTNIQAQLDWIRPFGRLSAPVQVGNALTIGSVSSPSICGLTSTRIAFAADAADEIRAYDWDGSDWSLTGSAFSLSGTPGAPCICQLSETDIAWIDNSADELRRYTFNGSTWSQVGNGLSISTMGYADITALGENDIAFIDDTQDDLRWYTFDGTNWSNAGTDFNIASTDDPGITAMDSTHVAVYSCTNAKLSMYALRPDLGTWALVGNQLSMSGPAFAEVEALNQTDVLLVDSNNKDLSVYRFDGTNWRCLIEYNDAQFHTPSLAMLSASTFATWGTVGTKLTFWSWPEEKTPHQETILNP